MGMSLSSHLLGVLLSSALTAIACAKPEPPRPNVPPLVSPLPSAHSLSVPSAAPVIPEPQIPEPQAMPKTRLVVRYKSNVRIAWLLDLLRSRHYHFTQHDEIDKDPHLVVAVPDDEKDAFIADLIRSPDIVEITPAVAIKMVVYFQKGITGKEAQGVLRRFGYRHHFGADGQRGRAYFYESGPPFIVHVPVAALEVFIEACSKLPEVKEVYELDWGSIKD